MLFGNYEFRCRFESEALLPAYKGSMLRGVFGIALKRIVCALRRQECADCLLRTGCLYPAVFETHLAVDPRIEERSSAPPHPFVIQPPATEQTSYPEGAKFDFNLLLFGPVNTRLPYFVYAFAEAGAIGIGKKVNGTRGKFRLEQIVTADRVIYTNADQKLTNLETACHLELEPVPRDGWSDSKGVVTLTYKTPLRIKYQNRLAPELPFHVLVRAMLRRIASLETAFGGGEPTLDYRGLVERAKMVRTAENRLAWFDWRRYSNRQQQEMLMGGMLGSVTYEGDIGEYLPLIDYCAEVHVGKQTTFGLGRFSVEVQR